MKNIMLICWVSILLISCSNGATRASLPNNEMPVVVDSGFNGKSPANVPFVTVTICVPGTNQCQTIDHIILDTGSDALRINASVLNPKLNFPQIMMNNQPLFSCAEFGGGYSFGSANKVDALIGGEIARNINFQIMEDNESQLNVPISCSETESFANFSELGANGLLGVGALSVNRDIYYTYESGNWQLLTNIPTSFYYYSPILSFNQNNNGLIIKFPDAPVHGTTSFMGTVTFGIGTQTNNQVAANANVFYSTESAFGLILTTYKGTNYPSIFDSGTSEILFEDTTINQCTESLGQLPPGTYCPIPSPYNINSILSSVNGENKVFLNYFLINPVTYLNNAIPNNVLLPHTGRLCPNCLTAVDKLFIWGLPFFYGRTIYVGFSGQATPIGNGPLMGYSE